MAVDKEALICLSRVYSYYFKCNFPLFYVYPALTRYLSILFLNILTLLACTHSSDNLFHTLMVLCENEVTHQLDSSVIVAFEDVTFVFEYRYKFTFLPAIWDTICHYLLQYVRQQFRLQLCYHHYRFYRKNHPVHMPCFFPSLTVVSLSQRHLPMV